jgi:exosortase D (VPLPA-CTERM-specific)
MIPLPTVVQTGIGVPLKLLSTKLGGGILDAFGIPAFVQGNVIDLGTIQLQVVDACSGLRYILPLLALGALFAYFFEKTTWKRAALVIFTIPIAVITNGIRIGATGFLSQKYGAGMAEGFFHAFSGWLVFMFAFFLLFLLLLLLRLTRRPLHETAPASKTREGPIDKNRRRYSLVAPIICICALLAAAGIGQTTRALPRLVLAEGFSGFPMAIGPWSGERLQIDPDIVTGSGAEEAFSAEYKGAQGKVVSLYIGYRGSPFMENENFFHSPNICLPSSGWDTLQLNPRRISQTPGLGVIRTTEMVIEQMKSRELVYFWFQTKKDTSANVNVNRFQLTLHALRRDNTYDLFIRPITPIYPDETVKDAEARMDGFVREMMPTLSQFLNARVKQQESKHD